MSKKPAIRRFEGMCKGDPFVVETRLTNDAAVKALRESGNDFNLNCADHVEIEGSKFAKANMIAWGFRKAEAILNAPEATCLSEAVRKIVAFKRPLKTMAGDFPIKVSLAGERSKHHGKYLIGNGGAFRDPASRFYGFAEPDGSWTPRDETPAEVIEALTS